MFYRSLTPAIICLMAVAGSAAAQSSTWVGTTSDWNTGGNWVPAGTVPNSPAAAVLFAGSGVLAVNISSSVQAQSLTFSPASQSYTVTSGAGQTLSAVTTISVTSGGGTETVNLAGAATGSLLMPGSGSLSLAETSASASSLLVIGPNTVIAATGGGGSVTVSGTQTVTISGAFATAPNAVTGGLTKTGLGKLILKGDGSNLSGGLTLNGGTLQLDYTTNGAS